jgi:histidinol-phosphate aminotransferase
MNRRCELIIAARNHVTEALRELSGGVPSSRANFVWLPLGDRTDPFAAFCESRGVIVRAFPSDGVRVTIGTPTENDRFRDAAEAAMKELC